MRAIALLLGFAAASQSFGQEPYLYVKGNQTLVLFRPRRISTDRLTDIRIGLTRIVIEDVQLDGKPAKKYSWHSEIWPHAGGPDAQVDLDTETWVSPKGEVLKIVAKSQKYTTLYEAEAIRVDDEIMRITTSKNKGPKTTLNLMAKGGNAMFDNAFKGLLHNKEAKPEDRVEFYTLDPIKGVPVLNKARVKNRVRGRFGDKEVEGKSIEIVSPDGTYIAYVSNDGYLLQVDFDKGVRLLPVTFDPTIRFDPPAGVPRGTGGTTGGGE